MTLQPNPAPPRTHWVLLSVLMVTLLVAMLISGFAGGQVGEGARTPASRSAAGSVPETIRDGGPVVSADRPQQAGLRVPDRHVVLTFDDGPTAYTDDILDVLAEEGVPATFFVIGAQAAARPGLVRRMYAEGHEVGVHTFTHANLANVTALRQRVELDQTQLAIAAATGRTTGLLRPPYSSEVSALVPSEWQAVSRATGYWVVYTDLDTRDWEGQGPGQIASAALPRGNRGAIVMLHDGGGDRAPTVAALRLMIGELRARGYTFDTVSSAVGLSSPWHVASPGVRLRGQLISGVVRLSTLGVVLLKIAFVLLAALVVARSVVLIVVARRHERDRMPVRPDFTGPWPAVSVVVPAYNEELGIARTVQSLAACDYPELEIIVVDDGSTDATWAVVAGLGIPGVRLFRQANAGKPAALNAGIRGARHDVLVLVDGDTAFEPDAMKELVRPLAEARRSLVGAVSGNTKVGNRRGLLGQWQHIEYVTGFNLDRRLFDVLQCMPTVPGAIGAFRREALTAVGGVSEDTLAEDTDLTMAICRAGWRVLYVPEARAWTEAPATLGQLWRQRYRWCYGTIQAMWKHRGAIRESGAAGMLGRRGLPYLFVFQVLLPLLAPIIDIATAYALLFARTPELVLVCLAFLALQLLAAGYAFRLDGERLGPLSSLPLQQLVYRQLMYLVVIQSVASASYGLRLRWQAMRRTGEMEAVPLTVGAGPHP